jgi:hypothetical protein
VCGSPGQAAETEARSEVQNRFGTGGVVEMEKEHQTCQLFEEK